MVRVVPYAPSVIISPVVTRTLVENMEEFSTFSPSKSHLTLILGRMRHCKIAKGNTLPPWSSSFLRGPTTSGIGVCDVWK